MTFATNQFSGAQIRVTDCQLHAAALPFVIIVRLFSILSASLLLFCYFVVVVVVVVAVVVVSH